MEELIELLKKIYPLSPALEAHLRSIVRRQDFRKGALLLNIGDVAQDILFIRHGLIRSYSMVRSKKVSNWFMKEGDIIISVLSFLRQIACVDAIEALEDCECWGITHEELENTYRLFPEFNIHGRIITGEYYCRSEERHLSQRRQKKEDKYRHIQNTAPGLLQRVQNDHMASYLGVSVRTYIYIRNAFASAKKRKTTVKR